MDPRGPHEGAPGDSFEISGMDKVSDIGDNWQTDHSVNSICDTPRKINNRLLFLTVEYVEEQSRDYSRMFPVYEQVPFSTHNDSPLSDFEHRVSPLDPNMSSAARYSPTTVQLPPSPFHNSVVVLQEPSSPLIPPPETNAQTNINYVAQLSNPASTQNIPQGDNHPNFPDNDNEEELVSSVDGELILMQDGNSELETSTAPLMLTGIPHTDYTLTRDFLVMQDDQMNVINTFKNQNLDVANEIAPSNEEQVNVKVESEEIENPVHDTKDSVENVEDSVETEKKSLRRSKRQIKDKKTIRCEECDIVCTNSDVCDSHNVRTIADQPVPSRAIATLPGSYLSINKISSDSNNADYGIFTKRTIRRRTQFGPVEGILCPYDGAPFESNALPLLFENLEGELLKVDVSDENASNWMRFVRPALSYKEQNVVICQQNDRIVFLTTRNIAAKEELKAGPSLDYATRRNLSVLKQDPIDEKELNSDVNSWPCFECNQRFLSSEKLQKHLNIHDNPRSDKKSRNKRKRKHVTSSKVFKIVDGQTLVYTCPHCPKVFPRSYSLKRHLILHPGSKVPRFECSKCGETFMHPYNRSRHIKIYHSNNDGGKEKENSRVNSKEYTCSTCEMSFSKPTLLHLHSLVHGTKDHVNSNNTDGNNNVCPQCGVEFKKQSDLSEHVSSQHGRLNGMTITNKLPSMTTYKCSMCYKRFATKVRLQQHSLVHGAEDQKPLPCNICLKRFMNNSALSCHLKTHRENKQVFECPMCRQLFDQVLFLKNHVETHRNEDGTFNCPHCQRTFTKYSVIRKHIRAHHCERKHKCQFCAKRFPTVDKLRMHLLRHSDYREFHCANCGKQFKRKDKLKEHMTRMHNSQRTNTQGQMQQNNQAKKFVPKVNPTDYNRFVYKCHQCLVGFKRRGMLVNHLAKRHPDVPPESVPELNLPILRQTRDYYCQYCEKVYKSSSKRKAHIMKNHPGAALPPSNRQKEADASGLPNPTFSQTVGSITTTPQGCQWCHKQYASKAKLLQHQRKKHPTLMEPADQIPRPRNRPPQNQNQPPPIILNDNNFLISDYIQSCTDISADFLKQKIIKISDDVDLIGNNCLDLMNQQFVRMRDIR